VITQTRVEAIILAAGKGERMGTTKPLVEINGTPALAQVISTLRGAGIARIIVVLGHKAEKIEKEIDLSDCVVAVNANYKSGMASSLSLGLRTISPAAAGFLIMHADMPYVTEETVRKVIARAVKGAKIVAPVYNGKRGFPVYLSRSCVAELLPRLHGEVGARDYIAQHGDDLELVEVDDPGVTIDIDRPEDVIGG